MTAAAGAEHPLIDIDFTFLLQFVIFAIMALVASRLLFRPFLKMKAERSAGIEGARGEAERLSAEAEARLADYETKLTTARARAEDERRKVRGEAAAHERQVTDKARRETHEALASAQQRVDQQSAAARQQLAPQVDAMGAQMASVLLGREVGK